MPLLDDLSGYDFEDVMMDVFRHLGYEDVQQSNRTADKGRDIIMYDSDGPGDPTAVIVECKHTDTVSRPVVQKLHSAVATYAYDGPKRGMVATSGRFTAPAQEYADAVTDPPIELLDGTDLREIAEKIGMDLYNGKIEIICERTLPPTGSTDDPIAPARAELSDVENLDRSDVVPSHTNATLQPVVRVRSRVDAVFETSVGVVNRINATSTAVVDASRAGPQILHSRARALIDQAFDRATELDEEALETTFDTVTIQRFGETETDYRDWIVDRERERHSETVTYTGDNNVTYTKECVPNASDVDVHDVDPVYVPRIRATIDLGEYSYPFEWYAAGRRYDMLENSSEQCVQCGTRDADQYTFCENCGSINCPGHVKTERVEQTPVCTGCAITERFALKTKYFYDEENLEQFEQMYEAMPPHRKALENKWLIPVALALLLVGAIVIVSLVG